MQKNPRPTRAECTDVSNAVFDGADCVMLSGESAKGKYPYSSVKTMKSIIKQAESWVTNNETQYFAPKFIPSGLDIKEGMAYSVAKTSKSIKASCIIVLSKSGNTAKNISKFRPDIPIITYVPTQKVGRLLQMYRGVVPVVATNDLSELEGMSRYISAVEHTTSLGHCNLDDNVIIVAADKGCDDFSTSITMRIVKVN
jgi:pyruvate kinase